MAVINCLELDEKLEPIAFHHTHSCEVFSFNPGNFPSDDMFATNVATVATGLRRKTNRSANSEQRLERSFPRRPISTVEIPRHNSPAMSHKRAPQPVVAL